MNLQNKHCIITGGTAGIGFALAHELGSRGARVTICGRDAARLDSAASRLPNAYGVVADVAHADGRQRLLETALEQGGVDMLVNNAGIQFRCDFVEQPPERVERELMVNLVGPMLLAQAMMPSLQAAKGTLVSVTSGLAYAPAHDACTYSASKAGLQCFTRALRPSAQARGVRVVEVVPPLVATELTAGRDASMMAKPEDVAHAIVQGLLKGARLITPGITRMVPLLARLMPDFLERKMNA
jgi:uncharacterized oxidoreductase